MILILLDDFDVEGLKTYTEQNILVLTNCSTNKPNPKKNKKKQLLYLLLVLILMVRVRG